MSGDDVPCRVTADLRRYEREQDRLASQFDEHDDAVMHDVLGNDRLAKPVQALLISLREIETVHGSFGADCLNKAKLLDALLPELRALRQACIDEFRDL